jgi:NDP-sugar pyrophosphorylase family protein
MQAVILAAGKGSRLHPITTSRSKAMLPILGRPIVERVMEHLAENGVHEFILVVSPDDREVTRYFREESQLEADVRFVYQPGRLGMADALRWAAPLLEGDFILSACDNLTSTSHVASMLAAWETEPRPTAILTLMRVPEQQLSSTGVVALDGQWVRCIVEKPAPGQAPSDIASLPLYCLPYEILDYLPELVPSTRGEYELQDALQMLIERKGRVRGIMVDKRLTLTRPQDLLAINRHYMTASNDHPQIQPQSVGPHTTLITPLYIEQDVRIGKNCTIGPQVYIERGCLIGDQAVIRNAILLRGAVVEQGANVTDAVVS